MIRRNIMDLALDLVQIFTFIFVIVNTAEAIIAKKKDRKITVLLTEKRKLQNDLFTHLTKVLDLGRQCLIGQTEENKKKIELELLNHKIFIWINLNRDNRFSSKLREHVNNYIVFSISCLNENEDENKHSYSLAANKDAQNIWVLIDKYIDEENILIEKLI
jgi:hypothetical protein